MAQPVAKPRQQRFGLYELDLDARELRKSGIRIKLQEQPFQILAMLLERPGEIVTRDELQKRLWPADTFVDFDLSLNSAVKKLRQALNDDSDNPRFIETLYRRGYRFIGPVTEIERFAVSLYDPAAARLMSVPVPIATAQPKRANWKLIALGSLFLLAAAAAVLWLSSPGQVRVLGYRQITHDGQDKSVIAPDGERLYFLEFENDQFKIAQVSANGGETSFLSIPFSNAHLAGISPDGSDLLVAHLKGEGATRALWSLPLPAGTPRRILDPYVNSAAYSPDGRQIVFSRGAEIFLSNADGSAIGRMTTATGDVSGLAFSPDGKRLRFFTSDPDDALSQMWEVRRDGSGMKKILPGNRLTAFSCCGHWTRDGKYYIFQSTDGTSSNIWALPEKRHWFSRTPDPVQLTNGPLDFQFPAPSNDGKKVFMVGSQPRGEVLRYQAGSGFTPFLPSLSAIDFSFSPDGQWMSYVTVPDFRLWRSRIDGSLALQLTNSSIFAELPRWSPDSKQIVFMGRTETSNFHAYVVSFDASDLHELIPGATVGFDPGWSPDGKSIVLCLSDMAFRGEQGIAIFDVASQELTDIPNSKAYFSPRWSPDGKYIAAITKDSSKIVLYDMAKQTWTELTRKPVDEVGYPSWSRDGQYLYFDSIFTDSPAFFRIRIPDGKLERIAELRGIRRLMANFGSWAGLAPDDSPLVVRDISNKEIYALDWQAP